MAKITPYTCIPDLSDLLTTIPADSIVSRTFYTGGQIKAILFGFAAGQELSEHTASQPAILHILQGEARLTLGDDTLDASAGTWAAMPAFLKHSVVAKTPLTMLLLLLKSDEAA
jgi:quercetin dioxygenase-like cupin family protein